MNMGGRIKERLEELGWKQRDLLERVEGLEPGTLSAMISRDSKRSDRTDQIAAALRVTIGWLTRGQLPKEVSGYVVAGSGGITVGGMAHAEFSPVPSIQVPQMAAAGSMGAGIDRPSEDVVTGTLSVSAEWAARELHIPSSRVGMLRFITGYGESMRPTSMSGDSTSERIRTPIPLRPFPPAIAAATNDSTIQPITQLMASPSGAH